MSGERKYFGTDGIRGYANEGPLSPEFLVRVGKAIAWHFLHSKGRQKIIIGKDTRLSGYMIETSLASGLTSGGADVMLTGPIPTPGLAYLTWSMRCSAGIMISASHNPFEDNGIKIFGADGRKLADDIELQIEKLIDEEPWKNEKSSPMNIGKAIRITDALGRYTVFLKENFPRELSLENVKVGLDCAHGAGYTVAPTVFTELGATVSSRGVSPNGRNINFNCGSLHPEGLSQMVVEQGLQFGLALDGDADRAIMVDEKGNVLDGDMLLAISALMMKKCGRLKTPTIAATVMSNLGLEVFLKKHGINLVRTQVGDRYVLERLISDNLQLGGEQSGHIIYLDQAAAGDGILTSLNIASAMLREEKSISELLSGYVTFPQLLKNVQVKTKKPLDELPQLKKAIESVESELGGEGRVVVRFSGTENKLRVMVEAPSDDLCTGSVDKIIEAAEKELGAI